MATRKLINRTGPAWTKKEASVFYTEFMKKGTDWAAIVHSLGPSRTEAMVRALHSRHRAYLGKPRTSAAEFVQQVMQNQTDNRKRRRTDDDVLSEDDEGVEALTEFAQALRRSPCKQPDFDPLQAAGLKRKRDVAKSELASDSDDSDDVSITRNPNSHINYPYMSIDVRKLRPVGASRPSPREYDKLQSQFSHCLSSRKFRQFAIFEWFYAVADKLYFSQNEFTDCLHARGFGKVSRLTRKEWAFVRNVVGRPRRLSRRFLAEERIRLETFRANVRKFQETSTILPPRLLEGQRVTAIHPQSFELHLGTVLGTANLQSQSSSAPILHYRVKFERSDDLPALVPDSDVMPQGALTRLSGALDFEPAAEWKHSQEDLNLMASVLKQLDQKRALLDFLQHMNFVAEEIKWLALGQDRETVDKGETKTPKKRERTAHEANFVFPLGFRQQYAAVMLRLEKVSANLELSLAELRWKATFHSEQAPVFPAPPEPPALPPEVPQPANPSSNSSMSDPLYPLYSSFFGDPSSPNKGSIFPSFPPWPPNSSNTVPSVELSAFPWAAPPMYPMFSPSWPPSSSSSSFATLSTSYSTAFPSSCPSYLSSSSSCNAVAASADVPASSSLASFFPSSCSSFLSSSCQPSSSFSLSSSTSSLPSSSALSSLLSSSLLSPSSSASSSSSSSSSSSLPTSSSSCSSFSSFPPSFPDMEGSASASSLLSSLAYSYPPPSTLNKASTNFSLFAPLPPLPASSPIGSPLPPSWLSSFSPMPSFPPSPARQPPDSPRLPVPHLLASSRFPASIPFSSTSLRLASSADPLKNVRYEKEVFVENILDALIRSRQIGRHSSLHTDTNSGVAILRLIVSCISLIHIIRLGTPFTGLSAALAALNPAPQNQKAFETVEATVASLQRALSR